MKETIRFDSVTSPLLNGELSFALAQGDIAVLLTSKEDVNAALVRLLMGVTLPLSGDVAVLGEALTALDELPLMQLRSRIGLVFAKGGLISNLKVWENLFLPVQYHNLPLPGDPIAAGAAVLERVGYQGGRLTLPGLLSHFERKQVLLARAMLMNPEVVIYDSLFLGLNLHERNRLVDIVVDFHRERAGRTSIFLTSDATLPALIAGSSLVTIH